MGDSQPSLINRTLKNLASGTAAGIAVCAVGHPFDTLKVRLQTQPVKTPIYTGLSDCFIKTLKWEGIGGLYKGVGSPLVGQMFFRATLFTSYYQVTSLFSSLQADGTHTKEQSRLKPWQYFAAGACTGAVASFVESPIDLFKTKMQIQIIRARSGAPVEYRHVFHAGYTISRNHGIRGIYQGFQATVVRNIPSFAAYFGFYELFVTALSNPTDGVISASSLPITAQFMCGSAAGFLYWFFTYPTDVVKSAMQSDHLKRTERRYQNITECVRKLYWEEGGWKRFYKGFTPCLLRSLPANAAMWVVLQQCRHLLG